MPWNCLCAASDEKPKLEISAPILKVGSFSLTQLEVIYFNFTSHVVLICFGSMCVVTSDLLLPGSLSWWVGG